MKSLIERHPLIFAIVAVLVYDFGMQALGAVLTGLGMQPFTRTIVVQGIFCVLVVALIALLRWRRDAGFTAPASGRSLVAYAPWLLLLFLMSVDVRTSGVPVERIAGFALFALMVGLAEEGLLRGVVLRALHPRGAMRAAVVSSLVFGCAHLLNMIHGRDPAMTIVQAAYATLIGIGFAGPRLYAGTIWPAVIIHALIDFLDGASRGFSLEPVLGPMTLGRAITPIAVTAPYAAYGLWLLARRRVEQRSPHAPFHDRAGRQKPPHG